MTSDPLENLARTGQLKPEPGSVCCCRDRLLAGFPWPQKETKLI